MTPTRVPPPDRMSRRLTVRVLLNARGEWEVVSPHSLRPQRFHTLDEAKRAAYSLASREDRCDVVVHDAYHRVVHTEHVGSG
jgi:hypothetical protein